ncbi:MAG TPA: hypothetical protein VKC89_01160 [Patescibacteria group bacterium]|nr:hypothetical protein [Patescibacteria group bacterium]
MNPNQQTLDPKLKETYDRVMGTQMPNAASSPATASIPQPSASVQSPAPVQPQTQTAEHPAAPPAQVFVATPAAPTGKTVVVKNSNGKKLSPVVLIVVGLAFFVVYTVVWLKVFAIF